MILAVFSVYDSKAEKYLQPFFSDNEGSAIRAVTLELMKQDGPWWLFADDYTLFHIGYFNIDSGELEPLDAKRDVVGLWTLKAALKNSNGGTL